MKAATALVVLVMREVAPGRRVFQKETPVCPAVKPVISYTSEKWVLKIGFLKVQNW